MNWLDGPMVGFDTETTGVSAADDRIVTAAVIRRHGDQVAVSEWLINPGIDIPARATEVHGITTEKARTDGAKPAEALDEIATALADALGAGVPVVGFNVQYDLSILEAELARHGLRTLAQRYPIHQVAGHEHIAPGRKRDPGSAFDWRQLQILTTWPDQVFPWGQTQA